MMKTALEDATGTLELLGIYKGIVTSADDPENKGRVKLQVPQLFGMDDTEWALPSNPLGLAQVPAVESPVWVQFEGGDPSHPVYTGTWKQTGTPLLDANGQIDGANIKDFTIAVTKYNDTRHHFNPPVLSSNTPSSGFISWPAFDMAFLGQLYHISAGSTNQPYVYWQFGHTTLTTSSTLPVITTNDCLMFLNKSGVAFNAQTTQAIDGSLLVTGSIGTNQLAANSITATQIAAGAINGQTITGAVINGGTINGGTINGVSINGGTITGGSFITTGTTAANVQILSGLNVAVIAFHTDSAHQAFNGSISGYAAGTSPGDFGVLHLTTPTMSAFSTISADLYLSSKSQDGTTVTGGGVQLVGWSDLLANRWSAQLLMNGGPAANAQIILGLLPMVSGASLAEIVLDQNGIHLGPASAGFDNLSFGSYSDTTDGSSNFSFLHGLSWTPAHVWFQSTVPSGGANQGYPVHISSTSTTINGRYLPTAGSTTGLSVQGHWLAIG